MTIASSGFIPAPTPALATTSNGQIVQTAARMAGGDPSAIGSYAEEAIKAHAQRILTLARDLDGIREKLGSSWSAGAMAVSTDGALVSGVSQLSTHSDNAVQATGAISKGAETLSAIQTGYQLVTSVAEPIVAALISNPYSAAGGYAYGQTTSTAVSTVTDLLSTLISKIASTALNAFVTSMVEQGVTSLMADDPPQVNLPQVNANPYPVVGYPGSTYPGSTYPGAGAGYPGAGAVYPGAGVTYPGAGAVYPGAGAVYPSAFHPGDPGNLGYSSIPTSAPYSVPGVTTAAGLPLTASGYGMPTNPLATPWNAAGAVPPWLDTQGPAGSDSAQGGGNNGGGGGTHEGGHEGRHGGQHGGQHDQRGGHEGGRSHHGHANHGGHADRGDHGGHRGHGGGHGHGQGRDDDGGTEITIAAADEQVTIHIDGGEPTTIRTHLGGADGNDFEITVDPDRG